MFKWSLAIFIVLGFFLRAVALFNDIDYDEAYTFLTYSTKPLLVTIGMYNLPNNHLLNSLLIWFVNHTLGGEPWWIRLPQFLAWTLIAYQLFFFLSKKFSKELALMVVAALAGVYPFVHYSSLARGYCLHAVLILNCWFLLEAELKGELKHRWLLPLIMALSFWTLPTSVYAISAFFCYWIWERPSQYKQIFRSGVYGALLTIFLHTPAIFYVLLNGTKTAEEKGIITSLGSFCNYLWKIALYFAEGPSAIPAAILSLLFLIFPFLYWKKNRSLARLWTCLVFIPWAVIITTRVVPPFTRVWLWMMPFFYLFAFLSLQELGEKLKVHRWVPAVASGLVLFSLWFSFTTVSREWQGQKSGARYSSVALKEYVKPGDFVAFYQGYLTNLEYWEYLKPDASLVMKRYPIAGTWNFSFERLHAHPSILRKDIQQLSSVKVWSYLDENKKNPELEKLVREEFPEWSLRLSSEILEVGRVRYAAFILEKH